MITTIDLSEADALLFAEFRKYQDNFQFMVENGVFDMKNGKITLNFDNAGNLLVIEKMQQFRRTC